MDFTFEILLIKLCLSSVTLFNSVSGVNVLVQQDLYSLTESLLASGSGFRPNKTVVLLHGFANKIYTNNEYIFVTFMLRILEIMY